MTQMDLQPHEADSPVAASLKPGQSSRPDTPIVEMDSISIAFSGVPALVDASLRLFPGEVLNLGKFQPSLHAAAAGLIAYFGHK